MENDDGSSRRANRRRKLLIGGLCLTAIGCLVGSALLRQISLEASSNDWAILLAFILLTLVGSLAALGQPRNATGWVLLGCGFFIGFSALADGLSQVAPTDSSIANLALWLSGLGWYTGILLLLLIFPFLFPNGRLPNGRVWTILFILAITLAVGVNGFQLISGVLMLPGGVTVTEITQSQERLEATFVFVLPLLLAGSISQIARYRQTPGAARQQMKWLLLTLGTATASFFILGTIEDAGIASFSNAVWGVNYMLIPTGLGIALLRYRLFDVDTVIRRGTAYLILTALLALTYFGTVILLQSLVGRNSAAQSPLVIVLSTLLIAALFSPLRRRVQFAIDRRFFRQKYDAQQVLARFAQTARDEVALEALEGELVCVVQEVMQPVRLRVWLKTDAS